MSGIWRLWIAAVRIATFVKSSYASVIFLPDGKRKKLRNLNLLICIIVSAACTHLESPGMPYSHAFLWRRAEQLKREPHLEGQCE